jgi:hypothetical protein
MISSFSAAGYLTVVPSPGQAFFEQTVLQREIGYRLLQRRRLGAQLLRLDAGRRALRDALAPAELGDAVLAAEPGQHEPGLFSLWQE